MITDVAHFVRNRERERNKQTDIANGWMILFFSNPDWFCHYAIAISIATNSQNKVDKDRNNYMRLNTNEYNSYGTLRSGQGLVRQCFIAKMVNSMFSQWRIFYLSHFTSVCVRASVCVFAWFLWKLLQCVLISSAFSHSTWINIICH